MVTFLLLCYRDIAGASSVNHGGGGSGEEPIMEYQSPCWTQGRFAGHYHVLYITSPLPVQETRLEKLLVRGASKLKKLLAPLKSSLSSYFEGVWDQSIKLIMLYFRFRFPQGFVWVCIGLHM